ncbi:hypothetical protein AAEX28_05145 [Lentisphaerota bacterium WC36G]|nr:hypothetical protein LJT99_08000 [Lentisphaerae bacterium WC36]
MKFEIIFKRDQILNTKIYNFHGKLVSDCHYLDGKPVNGMVQYGKCN